MTVGSNSIGFVRMVVCDSGSISSFCNPAGGGLPKPDVRFTGSIRDVKCASSLPAGQTACSAPGADYNPSAGAGPYTIPYGEIRAIRFTGRDTAAGNSYAAWLRAKEAAKAATHSEKDSGGAPSRGA